MLQKPLPGLTGKFFSETGAPERSSIKSAPPPVAMPLCLNTIGSAEAYLFQQLWCSSDHGENAFNSKFAPNRWGASSRVSFVIRYTSSARRVAEHKNMHAQESNRGTIVMAF